MPGMYEQFQTDESLEQEGVYLEFPTFRVRVARAGGSNKKYTKALEKETRPVRRMVDSIPNDQAQAMLMRAYAESVVLGWQVKQGEDWVNGIEGPDGEVMPCTKENVLATFKALPDLFLDIVEQAGKNTIFRTTETEADTKNS